MKKIMMFLVLLFMTEKEAANVNINFGVFYSSLNPYGEWIQIDNNVVIWRPYDARANWSPYSVGRWEYTPDGWYWDSYEPFGWATYHYGRWYFDDFYGWVWVPGYTWAPAWVEWRYNNTYIGWSPLPPFADFNASVGIHFSINIRTSYHHWHFVSYGHFHDPYVSHYFAPAREMNYIYNNTKYRTNYRYDNGRVVNGGVSRSYIESRGGSRIDEKSISRTSQMNDYTNSRTRTSGDRVVAYQPGAGDVEKYRNVETKDVKRSTSSKTSLTRDMVSFSDKSESAAAPSRTSTSTATRGSSQTNSVKGSSSTTQTQSGTRSSAASRSTNTSSNSSAASSSSGQRTTQSTRSNESTGSSSSAAKSSGTNNSSSRSVSKSRSSSSNSEVNKSTGSSSSSRTTTQKSSSSKSSSSRSNSNSSRSQSTSRSR